MSDHPPFDVVIATCGRPQKAGALCRALLEAFPPARIIVVDSSDRLEKECYPLEDGSVLLFHSVHKNQPYQRYAGWRAAESEYVLFLDDDMEILDAESVRRAMDEMARRDWAGVHFRFENINRALAEMPGMKKYSSGRLARFFRVLSGKIVPKPNHCGRCGERGEYLPGEDIEYVSGGSFAVRRRSLYRDFNFLLMDLAERKLANGEDFILGYTLSRQGVIRAWPGRPFLHNDANSGSHYVQDPCSFYRKVAFSRCYLNREYLRLSGCAWNTGERVLFHYFMFCRSLRMLADAVCHPGKKRRARLGGWVSGWFLAGRFDWAGSAAGEEYWMNEATDELDKKSDSAN